MNNVRKNISRGVCFLLSFLLVMTMLPISAMAEESGQKTVRVGWFEDSYNITGANGARSGYGYEYQQSAASYTGWNYDYVNAGCDFKVL